VLFFYRRPPSQRPQARSDESLEDTRNLPAPELIAAEIVEDLQAALDQFAAIASSLGAADAAPG
jgi:type I restriction enzyme M protein